MFQESEIIRIILGIAAAWILAVSGKGLRRLPGRRFFTFAYYVLLAGWIFSVFEHLALPGFFNICEHSAYVVSGILYSCWCYILVKAKSVL